MNIFEIILLALFLLAFLACGIYESIQARKLYIRKVKALERIAIELNFIRCFECK